MTRPLGMALAVIGTLGIGAPSLSQEGSSSTADETMQEWMASGHADITAEAFQHWKEGDEIPGRCASCHSTAGFIAFVSGPMQKAGTIEHGVPAGSVIECAACHDPAVEKLTTSLFPSGETAALGSSTVCLACHQGRAWGGAVDAATSGLDPDTVSGDLGFINIHYAAAGATLLGNAVAGGYEYAGKTYAGPFQHVPGQNTCTDCHRPHEFEVELEQCTSCHAGVESFLDIRTAQVDLLGTGEMSTGIGVVMGELHTRLYDAIKVYSREISDKPIVYAPTAFPYFFNDTNGDGVAADEEAVRENAYKSWTPRLLRAAYNYQFVAKDKGAYAHNPHYGLQLLIDSIQDLGSQVAVGSDALVRP